MSGVWTGSADRGLTAVVPVWGDHHVAAFLDLTLSSLLAPNNIGGLRRPDAFEIWIMTAPADRERLESAPEIRRARERVSVVIDVMPEHFPDRMRYLNGFNRVYATGIERARAAGNDLIMLCADAPLSDGSLRTLEQVWLDGRLCAFSASPRVDWAAFTPAAEAFRQPDGALVIPSRDLVRLGIRTVHPWTRAYTFGKDLTRDSGGVYWTDGDSNLLITTLLMHPWFISTRAVPEDFIRRSLCDIDGDVPDWLDCTDADIFVLADSDDFCAVECSRALPLATTEPLRGDVPGMIDAWADSVADYTRRDILPRPGHSRFRRLLDQRVHHHAGNARDVDPGLLSMTERFTNRLRAKLDIPVPPAARGGGPLHGAPMPDPDPSLPTDPPPFGFVHVMAVWGAAFTDFFLRYSLPALLSPGNIPGLRSNPRSIFAIYTTAEDAERLDRAPLVARLREHVETRIFVAEDQRNVLGAGNVYEVLATFHRHALHLAVERGDNTVFLAPDAIFSDGALTLMERRALQGHTAVLTTGIRTRLEDLRPWLDARADGSGPAAFPSRGMVRAALDHLHPTTVAMMWGSDRFNSAWPSQLFWPDGEDVMLAHCWHLHPLMIRPRPYMAKFDATIDGDFLEAAVDEARTCIVTDSDEICILEASRTGHGAEMLKDLGPFNRGQFRHWARAWVQPIHTRFVRTPIVFHDGDLEPRRLERLKQRAETVVDGLVAEAWAALPARSSLPGLYDVDTLRTAGRVFLYGSGAAGLAVLDLLRREGIAVAGFIDTARSGDVHGLPLHQADAYAEDERRPGDVIVVASQYGREIEANLRRLGIDGAVDGYALYRKLDWCSPLDFPIVPWRALDAAERAAHGPPAERV